MEASSQVKAVFPSENAPKQIALEVRNISKTFHIGTQQLQALQQVSFNVRHGVVTGFVGPDAAGKTTLMRLAAGLLRPDEGAISVLR